MEIKYINRPRDRTVTGAFRLAVVVVVIVIVLVVVIVVVIIVVTIGVVRRCVSPKNKDPSS